jgi:hemerythrin-like domain-containing protein
MKTQPIKRSENIMPLSRDHHSGLLFCWKIKQGIKNGIPFWRINKYINFFWDKHLSTHFVEEEILLFSLLNAPVVMRAKEEHVVLTELFARIKMQGLDNGNMYLLFVDMLSQHIRFEERDVFPYLEKELPSASLSCIGTFLNKLHEKPFEDTYTDEFWTGRAAG